MEIRKIFKAGNSLVLALPKSALKELQLGEGDHVSMEMDLAEGRSLVIRPLKDSGQKNDEMSGVEEFLRKYKSALDQLEDP